MLGLAFDPAYTANGRFYLHYTDANGAITIARFSVSSTDANIADPTSQAILVSIPHSTFANHNGGMLAFGADGCLYAAVGDGGSSGDPNNNAQNLASRLGKLLRISASITARLSNKESGPCSPLRRSQASVKMALENFTSLLRVAPCLGSSRIRVLCISYV